MTYPIANIIYGFPYTKEIRDAYEVHLGDGDFDEYTLEPEEGEDGAPGWCFLYSAGVLPFEPIGYFGVCITDHAYFELSIKELQVALSDERKAVVEEAVSVLPPIVQEAAQPVGTYLVWSDS